MREVRSGAADAYTFAANRAVSRISLAVQVSRGATRRKHVEEVGSLRVRFPTPSAADLEAVIINTAGGVAGGDRLHVAIDVSDGARLLVTSAAAEKVYRSLGPDAHITARLKLGAESALGWLPQEMIMFNRARLRRCIEVDMAEGAQLMLAETSIFGRAAMGECLATGTLFDRWRLRREGRLLFGETLKLDGAIAEKLVKTAVAKGGAAIATLLLVPGDENVAATLREIAPSLRGEVAASAWNGLAVTRFVGKDGAAVRHDLSYALAKLGVSVPRLWLN